MPPAIVSQLIPPFVTASYTMIVGLAFMFAEVSPDIIPNVISSAGVLAVLIWYLYYTTTKTLPDITTRHYTQIQAITEIHKKSIENLTEQFAKSLIDERHDRKIEIESLKHWMSAEICKGNRCDPEQ